MKNPATRDRSGVGPSATSSASSEPPASDVTILTGSTDLPAHRRQILASGGITLALLCVLAWQLDFHAVLDQLSRCDPGLALLALCAHYATYPVRGIRWRLCLAHVPQDPGRQRFGLMVFYYNFVDNIVPGMLGQVYAAHLARINAGVPRAAALGSIVFLRMTDSWVVLGAAGVSSWLLFSSQLPAPVLRAMTVGGVVAVLGSLILLAFYWLHRLRSTGWLRPLQSRIDSFRQGMWPTRRYLPAIAFLSLVVWTLESTWTLALLASFGVHLGLAEVLFLTMLPLLSSAFPFTPSGAGLVELTLFGCLRALGMDSALAGSVTVLNRFIDYWLHILLGLLVWALRDRLGLRTWRDRDSAAPVPTRSTPLLGPTGEASCSATAPVTWKPS